MSNNEATTPDGSAMLDDLDMAMASSEAKDKSRPPAPKPAETSLIGSAGFGSAAERTPPQSPQQCAKSVRRRCGSLHPRK